MFRRIVSGIMIALLLTGTLFLVFNIHEFMPPVAFAHVGDELSDWTHEPPTIDGVVDHIEWIGINNHVAFTTSGGISGDFYVMNDGLNLYIAVITTDPTLSKDGAGSDIVSIFFDNDHDGEGPELADEIIVWTGFLSEGFQDCFSDGTYVRNKDTDFGGMSDGAAEARNHDAQFNHFEFMHPLDTDDNFHDFSLSMNDTIGFAISLTVDGADRGWWPSNDPSLWRDITIYEPVFSAWARETPLIDGKLTPAYEGHITPEWWYADRREFDLSWGVESHHACLYVMNDYINLYLAFVIEDEDFDWTDSVMFNFDDDHDGIKEIGDNQLWIGMDAMLCENLAGRFYDGFFPTPGDAFSFNWDDSDGGHQDGVGAMQFTGETPSTIASYVVEVAYPLSTRYYDNDYERHDFYLPAPPVSGMDEVGVNVLYDDGDVVGFEDGWPTLTWGNWAEMATIKLAWPPQGPILPWTDLSIAGIEITQAVQYYNDVPEGTDNSLPLALGKSTIARVYITMPHNAGPTDVTVYLYATNHEEYSLVETGIWSSNGPLSGRAVVRGEDLCPIPRIDASYTVNFLLPDYWVMQEGLKLTAFVETTNFLWEDYEDNWRTLSEFSFTPTRSLKIGYYLIDYRPTARDANPNLPNATKAAMAYQFFEKVTPMPDLSDPIDYFLIFPPLPVLGPNWTDPDTGDFIVENQAETLWVLADLKDDLADSGIFYDQVCGIYANAVTHIGISGGDDEPGVFIAHEDRPWSFAHEIGHNYGFSGRHSWVDPDNPFKGTDRTNSSQTCGYDTQGNWWVNVDYPDEPGDIVKLPLNHPLYPGGLYGALMSYEEQYRWISPYEWGVLMGRFDPPSAEGLLISASDIVQSSSPGLRISGVIHRNNTGSLKPIFQTPSYRPYTGPTGPYVVELRGPPPAYPLLYSQSFDVSFESDVEEDPSPLERTQFLLNLPFISSAYCVYLWNGTILLDQITASANPPQVVITYPNGGEIIGNSLNVTWVAADPDGDPLTFKLSYSSDNGISWIPLSPRITGTSYCVDTSMLPGGSQWLIRVLASDGFYTSEDQSNGVFTVPLKGPQNVLAFVQTRIPNETFLNTSTHRESVRAHYGDFIILKGSAFDPEDGVLNGTALVWASDINGTLGTGRVLPIMDLIPGTHNITLTATDSHGNNATKSFTITVVLDDIATTGVTTSRTVTGQGFTLNINATVENQGNSPATFNVTVYANATEIETQEVALASGNTTTIVFTWNTTGFARGNYTIWAYAWSLPSEIDMSDNFYGASWILIAKVGDLGGGLPPQFFKCDGKVDGIDLALFVACYKKQALPEVMYLADLGGGLPPQFYQCDGKVDGLDLALFVQCYKGLGPDP